MSRTNGHAARARARAHTIPMLCYDPSMKRVEKESRARIQPVLTRSEVQLVDQVATITHTKRSDVLRNALAVYSWFVRQAVTGARVVSRKPTGEEVTLETAELSALEASTQALSPKELAILGKKLQATTDPREIAVLRERLARGFYGI